MTTPNTIVVGIDGSRESLAALRWAMSEAIAADAIVEAVHCWQADTMVEAIMGGSDELKIGSECMLDNEIAAVRRDAGELPVIRTFSVGGKPSVALLDRSVGAAMLVLGSHHNTTLHDLVFGKITAACLRAATCDVAIIDRHQHLVRLQKAPVPAGR